MKNMNLQISGKTALFMSLGLVVAAILCLSAKSPTTTPASADSASAAVAVTTEQGSVTTESSADTSGSRRITFTVRPRLGNGTNGQ